MSSNTQYARMFQKRDKTENWTESNFKPGPGEIIVYEKDENINRPRIRIGAENTNLSDLPFLTGEVYSQKEPPPADAAEGAIWINEDAPLNELLTNAGAGKIMAVNITVDQNQLKADKTFYDIKTSLEIGYFIYATITFKSNGQTLYQKYATLSNYKADQYIEFTTWLPGKGTTKIVQLKYRYGDEINGEVLPEIPKMEGFYAFLAKTEEGQIELYYTTDEVAKNTNDTFWMFARNDLRYVRYIFLNGTWEKIKESTCEGGNPLSETVLTPFWTNHNIRGSDSDGDEVIFLEASLPKEQSEEVDANTAIATERQSISCKILTNDKIELIFSNGGGGGANWNANKEEEDGYVQGRPIWNQETDYTLAWSEGTDQEIGGEYVRYITEFSPVYDNISNLVINVNDNGSVSEWDIVGYFRTLEEFNAKVTELTDAGDTESKIFIINGNVVKYPSNCYGFMTIDSQILGIVIGYDSNDTYDQGTYFRAVIETDDAGTQTRSILIDSMSFDYNNVEVNPKYSNYFKKADASNVYILDTVITSSGSQEETVDLLMVELSQFKPGDVVLIPAGILG